MKDQSFEFQWDVRDAGYRWIDTDSGDPKPEPGSYLTDGRPLGTAGYNVRRCNPLALYSGLFLVFSDVDPTPESVERFANKYGVLGGDGQKFITLPEHTTEKGTLMGSGEAPGLLARRDPQHAPGGVGVADGAQGRRRGAVTLHRVGRPKRALQLPS